MEPSFRSRREQLLVMDETVIDSHFPDVNIVILSLEINTIYYSMAERAANAMN
jgi:hypothetical protein